MSRTPKASPDVGYGRPMPWIDHGKGPSVRELGAPRWHPRGACSQGGSWLWFEDANSPLTRRAVEVCASCPVRHTCLAAALVYAEEFGVWGGVTARARRLLINRLAAGENLASVLDDALAPTSSEVA
jgi:WhiB family transcriptional regulator, redox-sensing transcriptional regulator